MSGYTPLFGSLTTGTLCGKWPDIGLWPIILSLADRHGIVDVTPAYLAGVTGLPIGEVVECMKRFCAPDPYSRSNECAGARLELIDEHRDWGWRIVNHGRYREKARLIGKSERERETGKNAERMRDRRGPPETAADPPSDSDSDSDKIKTKNTRFARVRRAREELPATEVPRGTNSDLITESVLAVKAIYPKAAREDWITAEKLMRQIVLGGGAWDEIEAGVRRYAAHCRGTNRISMNPANFFGAIDRPWAQDWPLPKTKADNRLKSNLSAAEEFMRRTEPS